MDDLSVLIYTACFHIQLNSLVIATAKWQSDLLQQES